MNEIKRLAEGERLSQVNRRERERKKYYIYASTKTRWAKICRETEKKIEKRTTEKSVKEKIEEIT